MLLENLEKDRWEVCARLKDMVERIAGEVSKLEEELFVTLGAIKG